MSTFRGVVEEFPEIRIDYFRVVPGTGLPLAVFLSHVHSDHLHGLESLRAPFVYCSATTRELLLGLEKYPHRMNFAKGILESRKQHYRHLKNLLKPIPLNIPTTLELRPGRKIRVSLFDANHCPGAVMFLIDDGSRAILYTGDIRSESWWVNSIVRNPILIPFTTGSRNLDKIYLDTTFATMNDVHRDFTSKADGTTELLERVLGYPDDTVFHFHAWTFGYEDVWMALANALQCQIHVDDYKYGLYKALAIQTKATIPSHEGHAMFGFDFGNHRHPGCLTQDPSARLHSCEPGTGCGVSNSSKTVYIVPMITRSPNGETIPELGAGGGSGDLSQFRNYVEVGQEAAVENLVRLCHEKIEDSSMLADTIRKIRKAASSNAQALSFEIGGSESTESDIPLAELVKRVLTADDAVNQERGNIVCRPLGTSRDRPNRIQFPYSRHSSYKELCQLVEAFRPKEVYPCVVDEDEWTEAVSMTTLFGRFCSGQSSHDEKMRALYEKYQTTSNSRKRKRAMLDSQESQTTASFRSMSPHSVGSLDSDDRSVDEENFANGIAHQKSSLQSAGQADGCVEDSEYMELPLRANENSTSGIARLRQTFDEGFISFGGPQQPEDQPDSTENTQETAGTSSTHHTLSTTYFQSQDSQGNLLPMEDSPGREDRVRRRRAAYASFRDGGHSSWSASFGLTSLGEHAVEEMSL